MLLDNFSLPRVMIFFTKGNSTCMLHVTLMYKGYLFKLMILGF